MDVGTRRRVVEDDGSQGTRRAWPGAMHALMWLGLGCLGSAIAIVLASAALAFVQSVALARAAVRARLGHPFREPASSPSNRGPATVSPVLGWAAIALCGLGAMSIGLTPREPGGGAT